MKSTAQPKLIKKGKRKGLKKQNEELKKEVSILEEQLSESKSSVVVRDQNISKLAESARSKDKMIIQNTKTIRKLKKQYKKELNKLHKKIIEEQKKFLMCDNEKEELHAIVRDKTVQLAIEKSLKEDYRTLYTDELAITWYQKLINKFKRNENIR